MISILQEFSIVKSALTFPLKAFKDVTSIPGDLTKIKGGLGQIKSSFSSGNRWGDLKSGALEIGSGALGLGKHSIRPGVTGYVGYRVLKDEDQPPEKITKETLRTLKNIDKTEKEKLKLLQKSANDQSEFNKVLKRVREEEQLKGEENLNNAIQKTKKEELIKYQNQRAEEKAAEEEAYRNGPWYDKTVRDNINNTIDSTKSYIQNAYDSTADFINQHPYYIAAGVGVPVALASIYGYNKFRKK